MYTIPITYVHGGLTTESGKQMANDVADQAPPAASWRVFISADAEHAGFLPVYLVRRGMRSILVWLVGEARWVSSSGLARARRRAGNEVLDWAADLVRRYLDDRQKGHGYDP